MSTLVQIESAVAELPLDDQVSLLTWLQNRVRMSSLTRVSSKSSQPAWLEEIRQLRQKCATEKSGTPVEQLVTEIRS
jgi:hypothetical protein